MKLPLACVLLSAVATQLCAATLSVSGKAFLLDGKPFDMWGIRTASASRSEAYTQHLIAQLDEYRKYGVNSVSAY